MKLKAKTVKEKLAEVQSLRISEQQWQAMLADPMEQGLFDGPDRRAEPRRDHRGIVHLLVAQGGPCQLGDRFIVRTRDISEHGVGFLHSQPAAVGAACTVSLLASDKQLVHRHATIASCKQREPGLYEVGIRLDRPIDLNSFVR